MKQLISFANLNEALRTTHEGFLTIAEESTAYPKVTSDIDDPEGLGFVYKWNMGYMHDTLLLYGT